MREGLERLSPGGLLFLYTGVPMSDEGDPLADFTRRTIPARYRWRYSEIDPDVFGEEQPEYKETERIAAVGLTVERSDSVGR